jgi:peroxiredoxin
MTSNATLLTWLNDILWTISADALLASAVLVVWAFLRKRGARNRVLLASLFCFLLFLVSGAANYALVFLVQLPVDRSGTLTHVGDSAPEFSFTTLDGMQVRLAELRGRIVLLNFFATWCGPCRQELPRLQEMWKDFGTRKDFVMIVVGREESEKAVADFKSQEGFTFPMASDPQRFGYGKFASEGIPRTYLISRDGRIMYQCTGFYEEEVKKLRRLVKKSLLTP